MNPKIRYVAAALSAVLAGCAGPGTPDRAPGYSAALIPHEDSRVAAAVAGGLIKHVVIIVQENRSFENIFAGFPGANAPTYGYTHTGAVVPLRQVTFDGVDIGHYYNMALTQYNHGAMNAFDKDTFASGPSSGAAAGVYPYSYLQRSQVAPYWSMATQFVLADRMFPTEFGPSFTGHLDLISGTTSLSPSLSVVDTPSAQPWTCDAPAGTTTPLLTSSGVWENNAGPKPCYTQFQTIANSLDAAAVSWRYYAPVTNNGGSLWSVFGAISAVRYGSDWKNVVTPETTVLNDVANGNLPAVSWVIPDNANSDHPGIPSATGPSWVSSVVNAIGASQYWKSTAIIVLWDDWGGWYDNVPPPQLDYQGLGIRVPCIIISPYAKKHYVSHTQYEFGSVLKFVEQVFGLTALGYSDSRANSLLDSFDFTQTVQPFAKIQAPYGRQHFIREKPSRLPPDNE